MAELLPLIRQIQGDCANCMERERALARIILDRIGKVVPPHVPATKADDDWAAAELQRVRDRANSMECLIAEAIEDWPAFDSDDDVSGGDLVEWFGEWRARAKALLNA